jgi:mannosyltransferase
MSSKTSEAPAWLLPAALTLLALAVRLPGIDGGLWADEIYSALYAFRTPFPESLAEFHGDNKHPFYSLLAHLSLSVFGESAWSLRLPSLLFGVASVPMLFVLGQRVASRAEAGFAAALLAVSYHHVWFSQNARGYSTLLFCALASTWLLLRFLQERSYRAGVLYSICIAVGAYTHLTFVFTAVAQFIVAVLALTGRPRGAARPDWRWTIGIFAGGAALAIAMYAPMLERVIAFFLTKESALKGVSSPTWAIGEALRMLRVGIGGLGVGGGWLVVGGVTLCIAAAVGLAGLASYVRRSPQVSLLLVFPALTTLAGGFAGRGTMYPRFFFLLAGFVLLIGVRGAFVSAGWLVGAAGKRASSGTATTSANGGSVLSMAALGVLIVASVASLPRMWSLPKQDYEGAMRFVEGQRAPTEVIATADMTTEIYGRYFRRSWHDVRDTAVADSLRAAGRVWFVYTFPRYLARYDARLAEMVERDCRPERSFPGSVGGGDVIVCTWAQSRNQ